MRTAALFLAASLMAVSLTACSSGSTSAAGDSGTSSAAQSRPTSAGPAASTSTSASTSAATKAGSGGGSVDVCSLMSSAQASAINHVTYGATTARHVQAGFDVCTYKNTGKHASPIDIQNLDVKIIAINDCYPQLKDSEGPGKPVTGVGDAAFGFQVGIIVKSGNRCIDIEGLTVAELHNNYAPDAAMARIIIGALH